MKYRIAMKSSPRAMAGVLPNWEEIQQRRRTPQKHPEDGDYKKLDLSTRNYLPR